MNVAVVLAETEQKGRHLPLEPWAIGLGAFVVLCALLLVTLSFGKDR
ncbi:MAG: hypothetical protein ACXV3C_12120 [Actinomycetes bacterium]